MINKEDIIEIISGVVFLLALCAIFISSGANYRNQIAINQQICQATTATAIQISKNNCQRELENSYGACRKTVSTLFNYEHNNQ